MKICDRCYRTNGSAVAATDKIIFRRDDERLDVCGSCREALHDFVMNPQKKKKGGRPKKIK
jgi:hypothetical protein